MTGGGRGPVVIDTNVFSADLVPRSPLPSGYTSMLVGRPAFISFQTVMEMRYGAMRRGWGDVRMRKLEAKLSRAEIVHSGPQLAAVCAALRGGRTRALPEGPQR